MIRKDRMMTTEKAQAPIRDDTIIKSSIIKFMGQIYGFYSDSSQRHKITR